MSINNRFQIGKMGEKIAEKYFLDHGYEIIAKNFRKRTGEIDLIAKYKKRIIFIEIKTRKNSYFGEPQESINKNKIKKIYITGISFMRENDLRMPLQIDVVSIKLNEYNILKSLTHFKNVCL